MEYYLAIDIGASGGRHMLGWMQDEKLCLEEVHRFSNGMSEKDGYLCWDLHHLFHEIKTGLKYCAARGKIPRSVGIDTWGVDFVLLDEQDTPIGPAVGYRDSRTDNMDQQIYNTIPSDELYRRTGIQDAIFNTLYQLEFIKTHHPIYFKQTKTFLFLPDYFNFLLTGKKMCEYTEATTSQMVDVKTGQWDHNLIETLGYPKDIFLPITKPGTIVGGFTKEIQEQIGFNTIVMQVGSHDTASAVASVPFRDENAVYISSGTWSLLGIELDQPNTDLEARNAGFSNEGGCNGKITFLKNIMGLWMIQSVRKELNDAYSYPQLAELAQTSRTFPSRVHVNDHSFLAPKSMIAAIRNYCEKTSQPIPKAPGELAMVIFGSLADSYAQSIRQLESLTGKICTGIHIVGGGCNNRFLNQLTEKATGLRVYAGPSEGTAVGNLIVQMLENKAFSSLTHARQVIARSDL